MQHLLLKFKHDVAEALNKGGNIISPSKRERPSTSVERRHEAKKAKRHTPKQYPSKIFEKTTSTNFRFTKRKDRTILLMVQNFNVALKNAV